jgi:hypothetical protein
MLESAGTERVATGELSKPITLTCFGTAILFCSNTFIAPIALKSFPAKIPSNGIFYFRNSRTTSSAVEEE